MTKLLFSTVFTFATIYVFGQPSAEVTNKSAKDSATQQQKFYVPLSYYSDSNGFTKAMPELAGQLAAVYKNEDKKTFFQNSANYYLAALDYKKTIEMIDSARKIDEDPSYGIEMRAYAVASLSEQTQKGSFDKVFTSEFNKEFTPLSFRKKVMHSYDSSYVKYMKKSLESEKEKLAKVNKDSLGIEDVQSLTEKYFYYKFYAEIKPYMDKLIDRKYKETFPAIKGSSWGGVVPVEKLDEIADPTLQYKLLFELTGFAYKGQDSTAKKEINAGLGMIARQLNLHEAAGVPRKNIHPVIVIHGGAIDAFYNNEKYKKTYKLDNPNIALIKELQDYGVKMIACGQLMTFAQVEKTDLVPGIKEALTAQTVISSYQLKGYVYYDLALTE